MPDDLPKKGHTSSQAYGPDSRHDWLGLLQPTRRAIKLFVMPVENVGLNGRKFGSCTQTSELCVGAWLVENRSAKKQSLVASVGSR